jgi:hypothetical protein
VRGHKSGGIGTFTQPALPRSLAGTPVHWMRIQCRRGPPTAHPVPARTAYCASSAGEDRLLRIPPTQRMVQAAASQRSPRLSIHHDLLSIATQPRNALVSPDLDKYRAHSSGPPAPLERQRGWQASILSKHLQLRDMLGEYACPVRPSAARSGRAATVRTMGSRMRAICGERDLHHLSRSLNPGPLPLWMRAICGERDGHDGRWRAVGFRV